MREKREKREKRGKKPLLPLLRCTLVGGCKTKREGKVRKRK